MIKMILRTLLISILLGVYTFAVAGVQLKSDHPNTYYVKDGDTLWDIASKFLQEPWEWPAIWQENQQIDNPHLIYPGDVLHLNMVNGQPQLTVERGKQGQAANNGHPTVKLSPQIESQPINTAIPAVSLSSIQSFLRSAQVKTRSELKSFPYLLAGEDGRNIFSTDEIVYARDSVNQWDNHHVGDRVGVYRVGERYIDPETKEILGYEALQVGHLQVIDIEGDVATLKIVDSRQGLRAGDRILPSVPHKQLARYFPVPPETPIDGRIIRLFNAVNHVGRNDVVVINKGAREGLEEGNLLQINEPGEVVKDEEAEQLVKLPSRNVGSLLLYRVFDKVSYGLIMTSIKPITKEDHVVTPE